MIETQLEQTDTELLLFIHASQRDRAKRIEGRRWDPKRKCWIYPKTAPVHDALVAEFGDELFPLSVARPSPSARNARPHVGLREEYAMIEKDLHERKGELEEAKRALQEERREVERLREINAALETKVMSSRAGVEDLMQLMQEIKIQQGTRQFAERMKEIAKETTGSDPSFARLVDRLEINEFLPIELAKVAPH